MKVVIVESPAKCKKIESYLGPGYKCIASYGHITELTSLSQIDTKKQFTPTFSPSKEKKKQIAMVVQMNYLKVLDQMMQLYHYLRCEKKILLIVEEVKVDCTQCLQKEMQKNLLMKKIYLVRKLINNCLKVFF